MANGVLSFPFRLTPQGPAAIAPYGSDQEIDEAIAVMVLTLEGERLLTPGFGVPDPAFFGVNAGDIQTCLDEYGPEGIVISEIETEPLNETQEAASIIWSREDEDNEEED